jgi:hypothetical protein
MKLQVWLRALVAGLVVPAAGVCLVVPAGPDAAAADDPGGIGIRLLDAPTDRKGDPRARTYIVDHVRPGTTFSRRIEVSNTTTEPQHVELYAGSARLDDGEFVGEDRGVASELTQWTSVSRPSVELPPGATHEATVAVDVPEDASKGERYGVIWASVASLGDGDVQMVNRVGIRIYLSVGPGGEPASDFEVSTLTASRTEDGRPVVTAEVVNVGGRAIDMSGELVLTDGPGSLTAGPFAAELGTTLAPGATAPVTIVLDGSLPDGPWHAKLDLRSGLLERTAEADLTFPERGMAAAPVDVEVSWWRQWGMRGALGVGAVVLLAVLVALGVARAARRRPHKVDGQHRRRIASSAG